MVKGDYRMDFNKMSDCELAEVMVNYINRVEHLLETINRYLYASDGGKIQEERIKDYYKGLKNELRCDANNVSLVRNRNGSELYMGAFSHSIREAAAFGFTVPSNSAVNQQMYNSVEEARYKLTKYHNLEEWGALM